MSAIDQQEQRDRQELLSVVSLGMDAQVFLGSTIGRHLVNRAEKEIEVAVEKLKTVPPDDAKAIRDLQNQIYRAESIQYWIAEAIDEGINAEKQFQENFE